jgi:MoaA/NifB/PqqE/SkfB family radical SAM enzyme
MKLITTYSASHERLYSEWFLASMQDDYEVQSLRSDASGTGAFMSADWTEAVLFKAQAIIDAIRRHWDELLVYSDVDVCFYAATRQLIVQALGERDIALQLDEPAGDYCSGFFAMRANQRTLALWQEVAKAIPRQRRDQLAFNRIARAIPSLKCGYLPLRFFGTGTFSGHEWSPGMPFYIPLRPVMYHANWIVGVDNKLEALRQADRIISGGQASILQNNYRYYRQYGLERRRAAKALLRGKSRSHAAQPDDLQPLSVGLDASTACQLRCPSCPTAAGTIRQNLRSGVLRFADFRDFLQANPFVMHVELSNWGEMFVNPELLPILRHAHEQGVRLSAHNGVNFNHAREDVIEALVQYRFQGMTISIDGVEQDTYAAYRVRGHVERVLHNIRLLNGHKKRLGSDWPKLRWQFVAFGHNQHEIARARALAAELDMEFFLKLSWDDFYAAPFSPVTDRKLIREESGLQVADRNEYAERYGNHYVAATCRQLWVQPHINFDGRLLGCCINHWDDFGNVFEQGLSECLACDKVARTKRVLLGHEKVSSDIPCSRCKVFDHRRKTGNWVQPALELQPELPGM